MCASARICGSVESCNRLAARPSALRESPLIVISALIAHWRAAIFSGVLLDMSGDKAKLASAAARPSSHSSSAFE
eukprot:CAMPEP_0119392308 /NCGR_PEP_ID=MMETSP1334-20130426/120650_1 /TAXON_ID=127549 /ORGANISM="Calcidiscus leptoporus, Strain RCC1130" /LENGTH=74 /DNA_ID=CAMNT_0007415147 /DNA_START=122 /DNA_END=343 /DNA_ORIENTATION=-